MNYKDRCRTCLGNNKEMRHYETVITISGVDVRLTDILQKFYNYKITANDSFPEYICINCVHQLTVTYSFKALIEKSSKTLKECLTLLDTKADNDDFDFESDDHKNTCDSNSKDYKKIKTDKVNLPSDDNTEKINTLFCVECKAQFKCARSLSKHCSINHPVKSTVGRECEYCDEKFGNFGSLINHMKLHMKPYACDSCWEGFYNVSDMKAHQCKVNRKKKNTDKTLHQCDQCGKSYPSGYIKLHMRTHGNDTPYACKYCPKKFKVRCSLNSHVLWKHKKTKNHICHICNATFVSSSSRSSHIRKEHFNERKHICATCGKGFFQSSDMKRHYLTHTGVKNFHCEMCDKSYQTRYGLNVHLKSHSHVQYVHKIEKTN